ncbi:DUF3052 family protein [Croceitalea sp. MTPC9]|uniref:DUF3052 family protein n=1 Tax=unclassified Croceitalea TaxID=2632280 RepID=UPI002B3D8743|nr:DUF3052 family protein [Croceitalea sp. MTPC6]GMN18246.1 DUF3052 family protein [Croceitalea sp. MTPC9]
MDNHGYSGTPLEKKLGIKERYVIQVLNAPKRYIDFFFSFPKDVQIVNEDEKIPIDFAHIFCTTAKELEANFTNAKSNLKKTGILWVSWPKKSSKIPTEIDKFKVMDYGLKSGLVDTKVAAIDADWSGHKFVYRTKDR